MWVPVAVALLAVGTGVDWSAGGADDAVPKVLTESIQLGVDPLYWIDGPSFRPGTPPGAPLAEGDPVPVEPKLRSVLVYMKPTLQRASAERADVKAFTTQAGGLVKYEYSTVMPNLLNLRDLTDADVEGLKKMPGVVKVEEDEYHPNVLMLHDSTPLIRGLQSQITGAGLSADGTGVRICVVDTGIDMDHIMYSSRIDTAASYDFHNNDSNPDDDHGHGSHVSGIALGGTGISWDPCGTGSVPFQGVAPEATLIGAKVLNSGGGGLDSNIIAGIDHCADQSPSGGRADVINMSIGTGNYAGPCTHSWAVAANNAVVNGVVAVAASGNENNSNSSA
jgi:subtilisin family serine protease